MRVACETAPPKSLPKHHDRPTATLVLLLREVSAQHGLNAENRKKILSDHGADDLFGVAAACQGEAVATISSDAFKTLGPPLQSSRFGYETEFLSS